MSRHERVVIDGWDPGYGSAFDALELEPAEATVDWDVEVSGSQWAPVAAAADLEPAQRVVFVDGVRRIDARAWITDDDGSTRMALLASCAAGTVRADTRASIDHIEVRRSVITTAPPRLETRAGTYRPIPSASAESEHLTERLQEVLRDLEIEVTAELRAGPSVDLVVIDGPLRGRQTVRNAIGYVKTHRVSYLPAELMPTITALAACERTPVFLMTTSWTRYSWYLRLPGPAGHPWAGVVRIECAADRTVDEATNIAGLTVVTIPRYASVAHKDPRAPQNLFPIAGLERQLRHRLGDSAFVHRALRAAASEL